MTSRLRVQLRREHRLAVATNLCLLVLALSLAGVTWGAGMWWGSLATLACCAAFVIGAIGGWRSGREERRP